MTTEQIKIDSSNFPWGRVRTIHEIGEYSIVEYTEYEYVDGAKTKNLSDKVSFHSFVLEKDTHHSFPTLDEAVVASIAYKHEGPNHAADGYFFKMIKN